MYIKHPKTGYITYILILRDSEKNTPLQALT